MPRSFLIKKHFGAGATKMKRSLCESKGDRRQIDLDDQHSCCSSSSSSDEKKYRHEHYIPVDLTPPRTPSAGPVTTPPPAVALIAARPSAPTDEHKSRPPSFALLEPLNLNVACAAATSWPKSVIPPYLPFNFPSLYPAFPQASSAADFYGPMYPLSLPQRTATLPAEQLSPFAARGEYPSPPVKKAEPLAPLPVDAVKNNSNANVDISSYLYEMWSSENKSECGINGGSRGGGTPPTASSGGEGSSVGSADMSESMLLKKRPSSREAPRYQCSDCSKSYSTFSGLSKHQQFHCVTQAKKSFGCKFCEKIYVSLGALKMHIRTHTLPCKCKLCGKAFSRPWLLQGHIRTHTGEKPFACPHCNRAFADRSNLRAHLQTHSDVKKYSCKNCSKTFSRMSLLLKHEDGGCPGTQH